MYNERVLTRKAANNRLHTDGGGFSPPQGFWQFRWFTQVPKLVLISPRRR